MARRDAAIRHLRGHGAVALGLMLGNVLAYALALIAARQLGPARFGELSALLALIIVLAVLPTGMQTVVARAVAERRPHPLADVSRAGLVQLSLVTALVAVPGLLVLGLLLDASAVGCALVALTLCPLMILGWAQGVAQGQERFSRLGLLLLGNNGGRAIGAIVGVLVVGTATGAVAGSLIAAAAAATLSVLEPSAGAKHGWFHGRAAKEVAGASAALLALFLCTNVDLLLARFALDARDAGLYAAGVVVAKMSFWLPQFAAVTALPRMVDPQQRGAALLLALKIVATTSLCLILGCVLFPGQVIAVIGGEAYTDLAPALPWFAAVGGLWALVQVFLYDALAGRSGLPAAWLWVAFAAIIGWVVVMPDPTVTSIVMATAVCAAGCVLCYAATAMRRSLSSPRRPAKDLA